MATFPPISQPGTPERRRELIEHVRRRAFERIGAHFEVTDVRYDEMQRRCRDRRGSFIGSRGRGEIWRLQVWNSVVVFVIYVRRVNELVTIMSEAMFQENWVPTYAIRKRK